MLIMKSSTREVIPKNPLVNCSENNSGNHHSFSSMKILFQDNKQTLIKTSIVLNLTGKCSVKNLIYVLQVLADFNCIYFRLYRL